MGIDYVSCRRGRPIGIVNGLCKVMSYRIYIAYACTIHAQSMHGIHNPCNSQPMQGGIHTWNMHGVCIFYA